MEDLEQKIGEVLNDPEQMQKIMELAQSLGLDAVEQMQTAPEKKLPQNAQREVALLEALKPFLKPHHQRKLEKAMQISKFSKLAKLAFEQKEPKQE